MRKSDLRTSGFDATILGTNNKTVETSEALLTPVSPFYNNERIKLIWSGPNTTWGIKERLKRINSLNKKKEKKH